MHRVCKRHIEELGSASLEDVTDFVREKARALLRPSFSRHAPPQASAAAALFLYAARHSRYACLPGTVPRGMTHLFCEGSNDIRAVPP